MRIANFRWINKNSINVQDNDYNRQMLGGLMRLFEHQLAILNLSQKLLNQNRRFGRALS